MEAIIVALIGLVGVVLAALIQHNRKEDKNEHGMLMNTVLRVESKIDGHIEDHAKGEFVTQKVSVPKRKTKIR